MEPPVDIPDNLNDKEKCANRDSKPVQEAASDKEGDVTKGGPICPAWTRCTDTLHQGIIFCVVSLSQFASRRPWTVVIGVPVFSILVVSVGLATNFRVVYDPEEFLIPYNTPIEEQYNWVGATFPDEETVWLSLLLHKKGENVLSVHTARKAMELMDAIRAVPGYDDVCSQGDHVDIYGNRTCWTYSVTRFWNHDLGYYNAMVDTDLDLMEQVSQPTFPYGGTPVAHDGIIGNHRRNDTTNNGTYLITFAQSYVFNLALPYEPGLEDLEYALIETLLELRDEWSELPQPVHLEFLTALSMEMEVERAIRQDLPLLPVVFVIMTQFCSIVFFQCHKVKSRWLLGYGAVITIAFSILTGFGIMFIAGVPVTSMLLVLPFIVFGIGLDDTFIITGAFFRTEKGDASTIQERMANTMQDIGLSITLTTLTTMAAFLLSSLSSIRAIRWLGWYAFLTIFIDFVYQITFFVALVVLDERRIQANRRDICFWIVVPQEDNADGSAPADDMNAVEAESGKELGGAKKEDDSHDTIQPPFETEFESERRDSDTHEQLKRHKGEGNMNCTGAANEESGGGGSKKEENPSAPPTSIEGGDLEVSEVPNEESQGSYQLADRFMLWYSRRLIPQRWFQIVVCVVFFGYFALCCYATSLLKQEFKTQDFVMEDSYVTSFIESSSYLSFDYVTAAFFRHVNQSDAGMQDQMQSYMDDLLALDHIAGVNPPFCWVQDFPTFQQQYKSDMENMTFNEQIAFALSIPVLDEVYGSDLVIDNATGDIVASRCWIYVSNIDFEDVGNQMEFYENQNHVSEAHPVNAERKDLAFFTFESLYFVWEFYGAIKRELIFSTIAGVVAVGVIGCLLIPHWSAICFLMPLMIILYLDVMGTIQLMGLYVDSMTFVCIIVSVGLLVDFLMHILLRYYESPGQTRLQKVQTTLQTMGASIFVGGLSTFLGILPLSLGTSMVMRTVFLCFLAMVILGVGHGLVFLPVLLCLAGPVNGVEIQANGDDRDTRSNVAADSDNVVDSAR